MAGPENLRKALKPQAKVTVGPRCPVPGHVLRNYSRGSTAQAILAQAAVGLEKA